MPPLYLTPIADVIAAADEVAMFRGWLKSQMDAQKARIKAISEEFSIPVPNLESNLFDFSPLSVMTPSVGNAVATTTNRTSIQENNQAHVFDERKVPSTPPAPRRPPALPMQGLWQPETQGPLATRLRLARTPHARPCHRVLLTWIKAPIQKPLQRQCPNIRNRRPSPRKRMIWPTRRRPADATR
jgi:hypothetical protein